MHRSSFLLSFKIMVVDCLSWEELSEKISGFSMNSSLLKHLFMAFVPEERDNFILISKGELRYEAVSDVN